MCLACTFCTHAIVVTMLVVYIHESGCANKGRPYKSIMSDFLDSWWYALATMARRQQDNVSAFPAILGSVAMVSKILNTKFPALLGGDVPRTALLVGVDCPQCVV